MRTNLALKFTSYRGFTWESIQNFCRKLCKPQNNKSWQAINSMVHKENFSISCHSQSFFLSHVLRKPSWKCRNTQVCTSVARTSKFWFFLFLVHLKSTAHDCIPFISDRTLCFPLGSSGASSDLVLISKSSAFFLK